jgi:hypothetical protein
MYDSLSSMKNLITTSCVASSISWLVYQALNLTGRSLPVNNSYAYKNNDFCIDVHTLAQSPSFFQRNWLNLFIVHLKQATFVDTVILQMSRKSFAHFVYQSE